MPIRNNALHIIGIPTPKEYSRAAHEEKTKPTQNIEIEEIFYSLLTHNINLFSSLLCSEIVCGVWYACVLSRIQQQAHNTVRERASKETISFHVSDNKLGRVSSQ